VQDLAALGNDLPLFLGVAVGAEDVDLGERVEGDPVGVDRRGLRRIRGRSANLLEPLRRIQLGCAGEGVILELALQLRDRGRAGPRDRLVCVDDHPDEPDAVTEGHEDRGELHRRAVRVRDDPLVRLEVSRIHLADDERHAGVHPPGARVVDDGRTVGDGLGSQGPGDVGASTEEGNVDPRERIGRRLHDAQAPAVDEHLVTGRTTGRHETERARWVAALLEDLDHRPSDHACGTDDGDAGGCSLGHRGMAPRGIEIRRAPAEYSSGRSDLRAPNGSRQGE